MSFSLTIFADAVSRVNVDSAIIKTKFCFERMFDMPFGAFSYKISDLYIAL